MQIYSNKKYAMYLRKSRIDIEAEMHGSGETLVKHEKRLTELAESLHIPNDNIDCKYLILGMAKGTFFTAPLSSFA